MSLNVFRPMSETAEKLLKIKDDMERFARQNVTGSVNNSNLLSFSSPVVSRVMRKFICRLRPNEVNRQ